ncbi:MAG: hypothetical protein SGJ13_10775, partial [Actinomycetota bacterium]|nr:hypothetical protein [Actinomycetota bacterium]
DACYDGGQATSAIIREPRGLVVDSGDDILFADTDLCRVRKIDTSSGVITTVVGTTSVGSDNCGSTGDSGAATSAKLSYPWDLALASDGDLYIADRGNKKIRKVEAGGNSLIDGSDIISTVAGTGSAGAYAGDGATATSAQMGGPSSVLVTAASVVLIPDPPENRIRTISGSNAATYAGTGTSGSTGNYDTKTIARFNGPRYLAEDSLTNVYVSDTANHCVRVIHTDGSVGPYAGTCGSSGSTGDGGLATSAALSSPRGLAFDDEGSLYIADTGNNKIRKVTRTGQISSFAGTGTAGNTGDGGNATSALLSGPYDVSWDTSNSGRLLVADTGNNRIRRIITNAGNAPGTISNIAGAAAGTLGNTGDGGGATSATLSGPKGVYWYDNNNIYIADTGNNRVRAFVAGGNITNFAGSSAGTGGDTGDGGVPTSATLSAPEDVYATATNNVYIADTGNKRVRRYDGTNIIAVFSDATANNSTAVFAGDGAAATSGLLNNPVGIGITGTDIYVADDGDDRVRKFAVGGNISTFAGDGTTTGDIGDSAAATAARLVDPVDVEVSGSDVYIAERTGYRIRKVTSGTITTYAGNGSPSYSGETGTATAAQLNGVTGLAINSTDRYLYISDQVNHKVRYVDHNPNPDTVAQLVNHTTPSYGIGSTAQVFGDGGAATSAAMSNASDAVRDTNGNVYVVERTTNRVRKISMGGEVSTFAGTGAAGNTGDGGQATVAQLNAPEGIALDSSNNVYIADTGNHRVRKITVSTGVITNHAGDSAGTSGNTGDAGAATSAKLSSPRGIMFDENGDFYIADTANNRVRTVIGGTINNYAGSSAGTAGSTGDGGAATSALLSGPRRLARDPGGNFTFIADTGNNRVRRVSGAGTMAAYAGSGTAGNADHATATSATFDAPRGLAWDDANSDLYIADTGNHRIRRVNGGSTQHVAGATTDVSGDVGNAITSTDSTVRLNAPEGVFVAMWGTGTGAWMELLVADSGNHRMKRIDIASLWLTRFSGTGAAGSYAGDGGLYTAAYLTSPAGLALDLSDNLLIADQGDRRVRKTGAVFSFITVAGDSVTCTPTTATCGDGGAAVNAQFADPVDVAVDASGDVFIADGSGGRIRKVTAGADSYVDGESDDIVSTVAGTGTASSTGDGGAAGSATINYPTAVAIYNNDLYIVERDSHKIRKVTASSSGNTTEIEGTDTISTVAGTGTASSTGDAGAATSATINTPHDVAFDGSGNMYIAERNGCRVRKVISGTISTIYGGSCGAAGDQGGAPGAYGHPTALALDSTGNLYIGEGRDGGTLVPPGHRIRKIYEADSWTP